MWFFNNKKKKERMKAENDKKEREMKNDYHGGYFKNKDLDDLFKDMYGEKFDDYFKDIFKNAGNGNFHYKQSTNYDHSDFYESDYGSINHPKIDNKIDNAFKLMSLNKDDDEKTIKKRYRELSMKWHPDKYQNDTMENQGIATRNFTKLNSAYETIKKHKNIN